MSDWITSIIVLAGSGFFLLAGIGILKLPDLYTRTSASTKAATLGLTLSLSGVAVHYGDLSITTQVIITILFVLITAPVSSHLISRAAYFVGIPLWEKTHINDLAGHYHKDSHELDSTVSSTDSDRQ